MSMNDEHVLNKPVPMTPPIDISWICFDFSPRWVAIWRSICVSRMRKQLFLNGTYLAGIMDSIWADREGRHGDFRLLSVGELALDV